MKPITPLAFRDWRLLNALRALFFKPKKQEVDPVMLALSLRAEERGERYIVCAAMRSPDGRIMTGVRHYSPDMRNQIMASEGVSYWKAIQDQGFIDNYGMFHNREEAWVIAEARGQIRSQCSAPGTLWSENLY